MTMASSYPFKEGVLNEIVVALLDIKHCRAPGGGSGGDTTPSHSLSLPPLPAFAGRERLRTKITLHDAKKGKRWSFASMPAIEAADHRSTEKKPPIRVSVPAIGRKMAPVDVEPSPVDHRSTKFNPPIRVSGPPMKKVAEKTAPLKNVEPSHSQLESYELYEIAPLKLLIKIIPVSNTKMVTFGKEEDTKGKRKIADAGLEGDYIFNTKKAKLSAKFKTGVNSYLAYRAPFNPAFAHFGAGETSSSVQQAPFSSTWRNVIVHDFESLHRIVGIFSCYEPTHYGLISSLNRTGHAKAAPTLCSSTCEAQCYNS